MLALATRILRPVTGLAATAPRAMSTMASPAATPFQASPLSMDAPKGPPKMKVVPQKIDPHGRSYGSGGRKTASARVWIKPGNGTIVVNGIPHTEYFNRITHRSQLVNPFMATQTLTKFDVWCTVKGGGLSGQSGAIRLGISNALQSYQPELRPRLKKAGFLTRDPRKVERKKPGRVKARKAAQWVKR